jgi:uncharacterized membrane protein
MDKTRLEAFTDGIFAIVVTLLVLDIRMPDNTTSQNLDMNIIHILPALGTYVLSYLVIGLQWIFHHSASRMFKAVDTRIIWLNIVYIMLVGLIPFTTGLLSKFTYTTWAIVIYGINLLIVNLAGFLVMYYLYRHRQFATAEYTPRVFAAQGYQYIKVAALYTIGIVLAFVLPQASIYVYGFVTLYLILSTLYTRVSWRRTLGAQA